MTLTIKLDGNWSSFQLANSAPPLSVTDSAIAPSARINQKCTRKTAAVKMPALRLVLLPVSFAKLLWCIQATHELLMRPLIQIKWLGRMPRKNCGSHIDASHSRQPLVKGERLVRYEVNAVMSTIWRLTKTRLVFLQTSPYTKPDKMQKMVVAVARSWDRAEPSNVTPKGALLLAVCHARATLEGP